MKHFLEGERIYFNVTIVKVRVLIPKTLQMVNVYIWLERSAVPKIPAIYTIIRSYLLNTTLIHSFKCLKKLRLG